MAKDEGGGGSFLGTAIKVLALVAGIPAAAAAAYQIYAVATGKTPLQDYINPPEKPPIVYVAPGGGRPATEAKECSSETEKVAWSKARESKTRADYNSYILAFTNCPNAATARDALLTCHQEQREAWEPTPIASNQAVRGVGSIPNDGKTEAQACSAAKKMANNQAKLNCEAIADGGGYRNPVWKVRDQDCSCNKVNELVTTCIADLSASCTWEAKIQRQVEVCG
jgi:hypothetical protein